MSGKFSRTAFSPALIAAVISLFTELFFNFDFFRTVLDNIEADANGVLIFASLTVILFVLNFLVAYLLLRFLGKLGKFLLSVVLLINSGVLYAKVNFNAMIDDRMIGNVLHTNMNEAGNFFSLSMVPYILFMGVVPVVLLWMVKVRKDSVRATLASVFCPLAIIGSLVFANRRNFLWIDHTVPVFGSQIMPWCYVVNTFRYIGIERRANEKEIQLPDAQVRDSSRCAVVLVIGESARRANFQLYGYEKPTTPRLSARGDIRLYEANAVAANTIDAVRAIVTRAPEEQLHEILPNYLERNGCDVLWRTSNWGEPPVHARHYETLGSLVEERGDGNRYDEVLFEGVKDFIEASGKDKVFVVIHAYTSHGPAYFENYPPQFEVFAPACKSVEVAKSSEDELFNAYDNTIVYTDWLLDRLIGDLESIQDRKCAMIFLSDHGESLGEHGRYMHGTGVGKWEDVAQEYQIPFLAWSSVDGQQFKDAVEVDQYHVYHSVLDFMGLEPEFLDAGKSIFRK